MPADASCLGEADGNKKTLDIAAAHKIAAHTHHIYSKKTLLPRACKTIAPKHCLVKDTLQQSKSS